MLLPSKFKKRLYLGCHQVGIGFIEGSISGLLAVGVNYLLDKQWVWGIFGFFSVTFALGASVSTILDWFFPIGAKSSIVHGILGGFLISICSWLTILLIALNNTSNSNQGSFVFLFLGYSMVIFCGVGAISGLISGIVLEFLWYGKRVNFTK